MRKILAILLALLLPSTAFASQVLLTVSSGSISNSAQQFEGVTVQTSNGTNAGFTTIIPVAGVVSNMRASLVTTPGAATGFNFGLWTTATTSLQCSIQGATATTCIDLSDSVSVAAGTEVQIVHSPIGSPTGSIASVAFTFTPNNPNDSILIGSQATIASAANQFVQISGTNRGSATTTESVSYQTLFPEGGTLSKFYWEQQGIISTGQFATTTLRVSGATTTPACSLTHTTTSCNDTSDTASMGAGGFADFVQSNSTTPAAGVTGTGIDFQATNPGDFLLPVSSGGNLDSTNATRYWPLQGATNSATEASVQEISNSMNITVLNVKLYTAPLTSSSKTFTLRDNATNTSLACTVPAAGTTCTATGFVHINAGDLVDTAETVSGTAGATYVEISYAANSGDNFFMWWLALLAALK